MQRLKTYSRTCLPILYARARETLDPHGRIRDPKSVEIMKRLDWDFSDLGNVSLLQESIAIRTELFDRACLRFVAAQPNAAIVNLGAGLDTRFTRVNNGKIHWFDVDLPEVIDIRKELFTETDACTFIPGSVLDDAWMRLIPKDKPLLFIAEGLLVYFEEDQVRSLMGRIADSFPGADLLVDGTSAVFLDLRVPGIDPDSTPFKWGVSSFRELEQWHPAISLQKEWYFSHFLRGGYLLFARLSGLAPHSDAKAAHLKIQPSPPLTASYHVQGLSSLHTDPIKVAHLVGSTKPRPTGNAVK